MKAHKDELVAYEVFPRSYTHSDGTTYPRKWLEDLDTAGREALGWYEVVDDMPKLGKDEREVKLPLLFTGSGIEQKYTVESIPQAEVSSQVKTEIDNNLAAIDAKSIEIIRKWVLEQPNPPASLVALEAQANVERGRRR